MNKISACLWFDRNAEEAVRFYTRIFKDSSIDGVSRYQEGGMGPVGTVMAVYFRLAGQSFVAINGGPIFKFSPAISLSVDCRDQREVDYYWKRLSKGGSVVQCGWLTDKFGVSWQVVPSVVGRYMSGKDPRKSQRVMNAILKMKKLDVKALEKAYRGP